jgi:error-prone DNA polymerase
MPGALPPSAPGATPFRPPSFRARAGGGFAEIGTASSFSFLRGASQPDELVVAARALGLAGLGLADRNTVAGVVRAHQAAREIGFAFAPGARLVFKDETPDIFAYPRDRAGWGKLCRLLSLGNRRTVKGDCVLHLGDLLEGGEGLHLALLAPDGLGASDDAAAQAAIDGAKACLLALRENFAGAVHLAAAPRHDGADARRLARAARLAAEARLPLMATNDVFYHVPDRRRMQDVLTAIRHHVAIPEAGLILSKNAERHLKTEAEMAALFRDHPGALSESGRFFQALGFDLASLQYEYPDEALGLDGTPAEVLRRLAYEGASWRYPGGVSEKTVGQIEHELKIIAVMKYEPYFLTVYNIVRFARSKQILCQGRGSAANSTVCYCLGITEVDPEITGLLFERFISPDRDEPPDIDVDFEHERREEVIQHIYEAYGRDNAAIAATVITYRGRSAAREVGKAFGLSDDAVSALSGSVWGHHVGDVGEREAAEAGLSTADPVTENVLAFANELMGFPRHLSQHVGGFVITRGRIDEVVPILNSGMDGRTIVEWDKDDLDELKILKIDILALGMLSCLRRGFDLLSQHYPAHHGGRLTLAYLSKHAQDGPTYAMTRRADTLGVFQIESRAQMSMLPKLQPREFYDFVIQVAIVRPGPIQGDMVHPYLKRRMGIEEPVYENEALRAVLHRTLGVPLFQEQAMQIAIVAASFTPGEADQLRRAMATFKRTGKIHTFRDKMIEGMVGNGYSREFAERCFKQIEGFGGYGFPESHAASFALLVYASCYMKCHYPDVFAAALLNAQPMGFYAPSQIVRDLRDHGVAVRPADVNHSTWDCSLEPSAFDPRALARRHREMEKDIRSTHAVRLGFRQIKGLSKAEMDQLVATRSRSGPYDSVRDLWLRSGLKRAAIERLADGDCFSSLGLSRRDALWAAEALDPSGAAERLPLFEQADATDLQREPDAHLPPMPLGEEVINDYRFLSLSLKAHPVAFVRPVLRARKVLTNETLESLPSGRRVTVSGLVLVRQRPGSAKGVIFMTIEDETGTANIIVWPKLFEAFRPVVLGARFVEVTGRMQSDRSVIHVVADRVEDLTPLLAAVAAGGLPGEGHVAPADHVKSPLPSGRRGRRGGVASSLGSLLARADEVRRPIEAARGAPSRVDRAVSGVAAPGPALRAVLPKGRNFQ